MVPLDRMISPLFLSLRLPFRKPAPSNEKHFMIMRQKRRPAKDAFFVAMVATFDAS